MSDLRSVPLNTAPGEESTPAEVDPFDLDQLRLSQDFDKQAGVTKLLTMVPCRKPNKQHFIRVRPGEEWRIDTMMLELKDERELYLVGPTMREELITECSASTLLLAVDRQGNIFLWPIRLPDPGGRDNTYWQSARLAAQYAETSWVRVQANPVTKAYEVHMAQNTAAFPAPEWPDLSFQEILRLAFKQSRIDSTEHPIYKRLRGLS